MKRRILNMVKILTAYILLNIGVLSWAEVYCVSENKLAPAQTVMAEIHSDKDRETVEVITPWKSVVFDYSFLDSENVRVLLLGLGEPGVLAAADVFLGKK